MIRPLPGEDDTIVALSTVPGRSAIAVVRLSGSGAFEIASKAIAPWTLAARMASLCRFHDPSDRSLIDEPIVSVFHGPRSYTGEDTVEVSTHGGHVVPQAVVRALLQAGAREAQPGEFTRRAVLNGKLDLIQAEAIGDLIDASEALLSSFAARTDCGHVQRVWPGTLGYGGSIPRTSAAIDSR